MAVYRVGKGTTVNIANQVGKRKNLQSRRN
jgi:hypothetical protein